MTTKKLISVTLKRQDKYGGLAEEVVKLRKARGWSQNDLAEKLGVSRTGVCRLEDPAYLNHSLASIRRAAQAFGMDLEIHFVPRKEQ